MGTASSAIEGVGNARQILVVDDDDNVASMMVDLVSMFGHRCGRAGDGLSALAATTRAPPDVVLVDLGLPGMNGFELVKRLRARPGGDSILIVAITDHGSQRDLAEARQAGFDHYLVKPVGIESLRAVLGEPRRPAPTPRRVRRPGSLATQVAVADDACAAEDSAALAAAVLPLIAMVRDTLAIDLVSVAELAPYDMELATLRWSHLRHHLH